ncbi:extracellular solute-binding protein [Bacillaceae bacterium Marseille-Q3522]|nr:extracellular solute-binding protein [Bacillaceae bacterium Marseille-Q3522]
MKAKTKFLLSLVTIFSLVLTAACSNQSGNSDTPNDEPVGKYEETVTVTMARDQPNNLTFPSGDSLDNNIWTRALEDEYGLKIENEWVTSLDEYTDKLNVSITSGDLPDIFKVSATQLKELADEGLLADLTDVYEKQISELSDQKLNEDGGLGLRSATIDGKLMGIPYVTSAIDSASMIWIRKDWLNNLGLSEPQSLDDVMNIARAFKNNDPDQNGQDDTLGLGVTKNIFSAAGGLRGFFNSYHTYPNIWIDDPNGDGLINGIIQPEMKDALASLQSLYEEGVIDQEFTTKTGIGEDVIAGKMGMFFGTMSQPLNPLSQTMEKDPKAEWECYPILSADGEPAMPQITQNPTAYFVVNQNSEHPAAIMKMVNLFTEKYFGETADPKFNNDDGHPSHNYQFVRTFGARKNLEAHLKIDEVLENGNVDELNPEQKDYYDQIEKYQNGDKSGWKYAKIFGPQGSQAIINQYVEQDQLYFDKFEGLATDLMVDKGGLLSDLALENFTKIITGEPVDNFDQFAEEWNRLGGEDMTQEVNDWYEQQ